MTPTRIGAVACVLAGMGLALVTEQQRGPGAAPVSRGGFFVLAADFHVHSFLGDGALAPWLIGREAARRHLDVVAVTNHNHLLGARLAARAGTDGVMVLVGQEVTASTFHMVAVGVEETVPWQATARASIEAVQAQGGVAIAAHPVSGSWRSGDAGAMSLLDGTEVAHPLILDDARGRAELQQFLAAARELNPAIAPIGSSDFHFGRPMGRCRTYVLAREVSRAGVLEAVRAGRTVAAAEDGTLTGADAHVEIARRSVGERFPEEEESLPPIAALLVLGGLGAIVVVR